MLVLNILSLATAALALPQPQHARAIRRANGVSLHDEIVKAGKLYFGMATEQSELVVSSLENAIKSDFGQVTPINRLVLAGE
jgi:hypothetical protein